jgi:hypothetical protein
VFYLLLFYYSALEMLCSDRSLLARLLFYLQKTGFERREKRRRSNSLEEIAM